MIPARCNNCDRASRSASPSLDAGNNARADVSLPPANRDLAPCSGGEGGGAAAGGTAPNRLSAPCDAEPASVPMDERAIELSMSTHVALLRCGERALRMGDAGRVSCTAVRDELTASDM